MDNKMPAPKKAGGLLFKSLLIILTVLFLLSVGHLQGAYSASAAGINIDINSDAEAEGALGTIEVLFLLVISSLLPSILLMMTGFTRIVIVLSFVRNAMGLQQSPPNQVIIGLALFMSLFVMAPVLGEVNDVAYTPYREGVITFDEARTAAAKPMKVFMLKQTQVKDLELFLEVSNTELPADADNDTIAEELPLTVVVPSFITSELKRAFTIGFLLFLPFLVIDMVVSSTLMSMGMVMLPPSMISLPFKLLLFILVDGWNLLIGTLIRGFR